MVTANGPTHMASPRYSLIVPAHNEAGRIRTFLDGCLDEFADSEVIVVLNGCNDGTASAAFDTAGERTNLRLLHFNHAIGKGGAVRAGFLAARAPVVGFVDADGATSPAETRRLFETLGPTDDAVIASRWMRGSHVVVAQRLSRRLASRAFNAVVRLLFGLPFRDTQCGAKVFRANAVKAIAESLETSNFAFDVDLLYALKRHGYNVREVPISWQDIAGSRIRLLGASRNMIAAVLRLRARHSIFRYIIPLLDNIWPTMPLRVRHGLSVLILNWRDPKHPQAGGAERYLFEIARRLVERGHSVHWLTASFKGAPREDSIDGISITRVGNRFSVYALIPYTYLRYFRDRFDAIIDAENGIPFFSPFFSLKPKVCLVFHVHQRVFEKYLLPPIAFVFKWLEARLMPFAYASSRFVAISEDTKAELANLGVDEERIDIAHSGVDSSLVAGPKSERPRVLYVGRLKAYKRVDRLIAAMPEVLASVPDAELVIAGTGDAKDGLAAYARELGVSSRVSFEGFVDERRKAALMASSWVFAMPSEMEGWGLTIIEANACGTPAVGFPVPGVGEAIVDGVSGLLVEDADSLAPVIVRVLHDERLRAELSRGAVMRAGEFSWDRATDVILESLRVEGSRSHTSMLLSNDGYSVVPHRRLSVALNVDSIPHNNGKLVNNRREAV